MGALQVTGSLTTLGTSDLVSAQGAPSPAQLTSKTGRKAAESLVREGCLLISPKAAVHKYHIVLCSPLLLMFYSLPGQCSAVPREQSKEQASRCPYASSFWIPGLRSSGTFVARQSPSHKQSGLCKLASAARPPARVQPWCCPWLILAKSLHFSGPR